MSIFYITLDDHKPVSESDTNILHIFTQKLTNNYFWVLRVSPSIKSTKERS